MIQVSAPKPEPSRQVTIKVDKTVLPRARRARHRRTWSFADFDVLTQPQARVAVRQNQINLQTRSPVGAMVSGEELTELQFHEALYPLRRPLFVLYMPHPAGFQVETPSLQAIPGLRGQGETAKAARLHLASNLHRLVEDHHRVPPHLKSEADRQIDQVLGELIDWERFDVLNPVEQPLWGRILTKNSDGSLRVYWFLGPHDLRDAEGKLPVRDVPASLDDLEAGEWFYGSGRAYPHRIHWTQAPAAVPDPHDKQAAKAAWDLIPVKVMDDPHAWPLKRSGGTDGGT